MDDVNIQAKYRGLGYGTKMMKAIVRKYGPCRLAVNYTNWAARRCYEKAGFTRSRWYDIDMRMMYYDGPAQTAT